MRTSSKNQDLVYSLVNLPRLLNQADQTINRILNTMEGMLALKNHSLQQPTFFSMAIKTVNNKELQNNQMALQNAHNKLQILKSTYDLQYEKEYDNKLNSLPPFNLIS